MRWGDFRRSDNVEEGSAGGGGGGMGFGGPVRLSGGVIIVAVVAGLIFGINPLDMLGALTGGGPVTQQQPPAPQAPSKESGVRTAPPNASRDFVSAILGSTEEVWGKLFTQMGSRYDPPKLHLFHGTVRSSCGNASAASGPFYCAADRKVYLDTAFFDELERRFAAPGDFARGYVIAHEVGHHVQNLLGVMDQFDRQQQSAGQGGRNALSIRLELQADCFAGVWGHYVQSAQLLDPGDVEAGLRAASAVGDDQIQKRTQGYVVPDSFTHGSATQRVKWFRTGFDSGDVRACNTFSARDL